MSIIRSLLWIGPAEGLAADRVADRPTLDVTWVRSPDEALALPAARFDAALLDGTTPETALHELRTLTRNPGFPPVLVRIRATRDGARLPAGALLDAGAADLLLADDSDGGGNGGDELAERLDRVIRSGRAAWVEPLPDSATLPGLEAHSLAMRKLLGLAARAARSRATVLIAGETGTGKEVLARALHAGGPRAARPFVAVNCAAFPDTLLESELFGHVKGAFTGADRDNPGLFVAADGGTLFLDEVGETAGPLQARLLRALQEREVRPVGGTRARSVDVRVVAASNRDLQREVEQGRFRNDLYYRLAVFPIRVPPLRARREDVLPLARRFLALHGRRESIAGCTLSRAAEHLLLAYDWPGNVRELENEMQRALALAEPGEPITPRLLSERLTSVLEPLAEPPRRRESLSETMERVEAWLIRRALDRNGGHRAATARRLGVTREGLYKKMKRLGIE